MRIFASIAFLFGGAVSVFILLAVSSFGHSQAGMSAVSVSRPSVDSLIPWIAGAYFVVSAVSALLARNRIALKFGAVLSHLVLLGFYLSICSEVWDDDSGKFWSGVVMLAVITLVFFSPWFALWGWMLAKRNDTA
jgi:threonine/homoserine/homoserine lactone efflux protein